MSRSILNVLCGCALAALLLVPTAVLAHETINVGDYAIEYGWASEPPVAGQPNAFHVNVSGGSGEIDASQLTVQVVYGGRTQDLILEPASEEAKDQFVAHITPTRAGQYTLRFGGKLGTTDVNAEVQPEEVQLTDPGMFPESLPSASELSSQLAAAEKRASSAQLVGTAGLAAGLLGLAAGGYSLMRRK